MIGYLNGKVRWKKDRKMIINVNGVGYLVEVAHGGNLPPKGNNIELYIYTHVREDTLALYGFRKMEEKELFQTLLGVSGIGPKAAVNIMVTLSFDQFVNAILTENISVLKQISGIGNKTAQRLILELKNKINKLASSIGNIDKYQQVDEELMEALQALGYSAEEISSVLSDVEVDKNQPLEERIRKILAYLGKGS